MQQLALRLSTRPEASFASFLPGRNVEVVQALQALASGHGGERLVYLWGAPGCGRSHLLHAVGQAAVAAGREARVLAGPVDAAALTEVPAEAVVALARVEALDAAAQVALFGLYNRIREATGALVVAGDAPPSRLGVRSDLATRLAWGLVYEVHALSDEEKAQAMRARAAARGFELPAEAQAYVLRHGRRDLPSLLSLVDRIDRRSLELQRPVTLPLVRELLKEADAYEAQSGEAED